MTLDDDTRKRAVARFAVESDRHPDRRSSYDPNLFDVDVVACRECAERHHVLPESSADFPKPQWCYGCQDMHPFDKVDELRYD